MLKLQGLLPDEPAAPTAAAPTPGAPAAATDAPGGDADDPWVVHAPWEARTDEKSGHPYYFNMVTENSVWVKPALDDDGGAAEARKARATAAAEQGEQTGSAADPFGGGGAGAGGGAADPFGSGEPVAAPGQQPAQLGQADPFGAALASAKRPDPFASPGEPAAKRQRSETPPERVD